MADEFTQMRTQWRSLQVAEGYDVTDPAIAAVLQRITADAQTWWDKLDKAPERTFLWDDARLDVDKSFAISRSFGRLYAMALAWATPGSGLAADAALLADTIAGLDWMVEHCYREDGSIIGNWYEWQISGPMAFNDAVLLLYGRLSTDQIGAYTRAVANFTPAPTGSAANRALTSNVVVGRGVLAGDPAAVVTGVAGLPPVLAYVTSGDGFYTDGSFIQHDYFPYLGGYGALILESLGPIMTTVAGTQWALSAPILYRWLHEAFEPVIWNGALFEAVGADTPVSAVLRKRSGHLEVAIACPSRVSTPTTVHLDVRATKVVSADGGVEVSSLDPLTFSVDFADDPGATKALKVSVY